MSTTLTISTMPPTPAVMVLSPPRDADGTPRTWTPIDEGSYGKVFVYTDVATRTRRVVKKAKDADGTIYWGDRGPNPMLEHEARILRELSHVNIVRCFDSSPTELHMEYGGRNLFSVVAEKAVAGRETELGTQLLDALVYLHDECHVVHRDIKLDNLTVTKEGTLKLVDFGFATRMRQRADGGYCPMVRGRLGSEAYAAPEILALKSGESYDARLSDVWSAGVVLFAMRVRGFPCEAARAGDAFFERFVAQQDVAGLASISCCFPKYFDAGPYTLAMNHMMIVPPEYRASAAEARRMLSA